MNSRNALSQRSPAHPDLIIAASVGNYASGHAAPSWVLASPGILTLYFFCLQQEGPLLMVGRAPTAGDAMEPVLVRARLTDALAPSRCLVRWQRRIPASFYQQYRPLCVRNVRQMLLFHVNVTNVIHVLSAPQCTSAVLPGVRNASCSTSCQHRCRRRWT